jgi:hypothetical protein
MRADGEVLYRIAGAQDLDFGNGTFWTTDRDRAEWLAAWEGGGLMPEDPRAYGFAFPADHSTEMSEFDVSNIRGLVTPQALRTHAGFRAARDGYRWLRLIKDGRPWNGALLYLRDGPLRAQLIHPWPGEED